MSTEPTTERLARVLREAGLGDMADAALRGRYDDYKSESPTPELDLHRDLMRAGRPDLAARVVAGEWDATREEAEAWEQTPEGQATIAWSQTPEGRELFADLHEGLDDAAQRIVARGELPEVDWPGAAASAKRIVEHGLFDGGPPPLNRAQRRAQRRRGGPGGDR